MSLPQFDLENAIRELRAAKAAKVATGAPSPSGETVLGRLPQFDVESAVAELKAAKVAKAAKALAPGAPELPQPAQTSATLATLAEGHAEIAFFYEERAGVREHDGGMIRAEAELAAFEDTVRHWRACNPLASSGGTTCAHCRGPHPCTPLLARGGHVWLHRDCLPAADAKRDAEARAAVHEALRRAAAHGLISGMQPHYSTQPLAPIQ